MTGGDPQHCGDLATFSVMRTVLPSRGHRTAGVRADIGRLVDDLERRSGRDAVIALIGSLALQALWPLEQRAHQSGTSVGAELDADEQRVLALLDAQRWGDRD